MAAPSEPPVFVQLVFGDTTMGALTEITGVVCGESVSACLRHIFHDLSVELNGIGASQVKLFLSDEAGIEASPPDYKGTALEPDETLRDEVLGRLNPTGAGADVSVPKPLYLLAVVTGAWRGRGGVSFLDCWGVRTSFHLPSCISCFRRAGSGSRCHVTQGRRIA